MIPIRKPLATIAGIMGTKNIPQKLDRSHKDILLLCRRFFGFRLCAGSDAAQAYKFIKYFIDSPCSEDDLELARGLKDSFLLHLRFPMLLCLLSNCLK